MAKLRTGLLVFTAVIFTGFLLAQDAQATNWGSWGSSRGSAGSWGSSRGSLGSWGGSRGGYRTPVRNLLGRLGSRLTHASYGSGGSRGWASRGGRFVASRGSWGGSSRGYSYVSTSAYGSWGSSRGSTYLSSSVPTTYSYSSDMSSVCDPMTINSGIMSSGVPMQSYPLDSQVPMGSEITAPGIYDTPIYDGVPTQDLPGQSPFQSVPTEGLDSNPVDPPSPSPAEEDISIPRAGSNGVLTVNVPSDARVYINGKATTTAGTKRSYVSRRLKSGKVYTYQVKVVVDRDGQEVVKHKTVKLTTGIEEMVAFNFDRPAMTTLTLNVPRDAKVLLCGCETSAKGTQRHYRTKSLLPGEVWDDYTVKVFLEKDGKRLTRTETISIVGGEVRTLDFDFSAADKIVAK